MREDFDLSRQSSIVAESLEKKRYSFGFFSPPEADFTDPISSGNRVENKTYLILLILSKFRY
jgi:hypothetical protein